VDHRLDPCIILVIRLIFKRNHAAGEIVQAVFVCGNVAQQRERFGQKA
jgi:hypothetical protein